MIEGTTVGSGGEIYVGPYLLRVGSAEGARVSAVAPEIRPRPVRRTGAVRILPAPVPDLVDREHAIEATKAALSTGSPVEFFAPDGGGKSTLLAYLAHRLPHPGATLHLSALRASLEDIAQDLFEGLFEHDAHIKVTPLGLRELLSTDGTGRVATPVLVLLDDVEIEPEAIEALIASTAGCVLVLATPERRLWGEGRAEALEGFTADLALALFERALGRPLRGDERAPARSLASLLGGRPSSIVLAAGLARAEGLALQEVETRVRASSVESAAVDGLDGEEMRMAASLAALGGVGVSITDLAAIAGGPEDRAALDGLARRGIARSGGNRFGMGLVIAAEVARRMGLAEVERRALRHFAEEAKQRGGDPAWIAAESAVLLEVLDRASAARHWRDTFDFARQLEGGFALVGRWGAWEHALELALQAARHSRDVRAEAWALHQRGTRALCLGAARQAQQDLEDALALREALGDVAGAAASRRNLEYVPEGMARLPAVPSEAPVAIPSAAAGVSGMPSPWFFLALALGSIAVVTIVLLILLGRETSTGGSKLVADAAGVEYGEGALGVSSDPRVVVIENRSGEPVLIRAVRVRGGGERDFVVLRDECTGRTLAPGEGCSIVATFVPIAIGERVADLVFESEEGSPIVVLHGVGASAEAAVVSDAPAATTAALEVSPGRVEFGDQIAGSTAGPFPITFVNRGAGTARPVIRLDAGPTREFTIARDLCTNVAVSPGEGCVVEVAFRPAGTGLRGAIMIARDAATNRTWTIGLAGRGIAESGLPVATPTEPLPVVAAAPGGGFPLAGPDRITFGQQQPGTRSTIQSVLVENRLDEEVRITQVRLSGIDAGSFGIANDRCSGSILGPRARCALDVWFLPAGGGERQASLVLRDGAGDVAREIVLAGTGG